MTEISSSTVLGKKLKGVGNSTAHLFHLKEEWEEGQAI
jgi:hypothetical protein